MTKLLTQLLIIFCLALVPLASYAVDSREKDIEELVTSEMKIWANKDIIVNAIKSQNDKNKDISIADMKILDNKWTGEKRMLKRPLAIKVLSTELSGFLKTIQDESDGLYTEIIVMDNKGMNVGQSVMSQNYWQGDQPKWEKIFPTKSYSTYISDLHFDDNTELFQVEVSFLLMSDEEPIGVVYAGIDVERLADWKKKKEGN
jgi:hypothetical protein